MTADDLPHAIIYTDGACDPNPGPGGWAALIRIRRAEQVLQGREDPSTNNRMELTAALAALESLPMRTRVDLYTDSMYLQKGITEWLPAWKRRNWRRKGGRLANVDLWKKLDALIQQHVVEWHWVRGHAGDQDNQRVDRLARQAIRS